MSFDRDLSVSTITAVVSIPFDQGDVFRRRDARLVALTNKSQSLSIRAMSFDQSLFKN